MIGLGQISRMGPDLVQLHLWLNDARTWLGLVKLFSLLNVFAPRIPRSQCRLCSSIWNGLPALTRGQTPDRSRGNLTLTSLGLRKSTSNHGLFPIPHALPKYWLKMLLISFALFFGILFWPFL